MQSSKRKIAIIVGVGFLAAFVFLLFRARDLSPGYVTLRTYLDDAAGLMDGTQVRLNGIPIGYLDAQNPDRILAELRGLVTRAGPTPREVLLLRGLAHQAAWAGRVAHGRAGTG